MNKLLLALAFALAGAPALAQLMPPGPATPPTVTPTPAPGLYVQVLDGMVNLSNNGGSQNFSAGQFGFVPSFTTPPIILPQNPGLQFNPPPVFNSSSGATPPSAPANSGNVDCIVR
jgi:hypothetical protein